MPGEKYQKMLDELEKAYPDAVEEVDQLREAMDADMEDEEPEFGADEELDFEEEPLDDEPLDDEEEPEFEDEDEDEDMYL